MKIGAKAIKVREEIFSHQSCEYHSDIAEREAFTDDELEIAEYGYIDEIGDFHTWNCFADSDMGHPIEAYLRSIGEMHKFNEEV